MNCAQNEKKGAAKKPVKRLATTEASRIIRAQQRSRARRGVANATNLRPLKGTSTKANALPERPAKAVGVKAVKPKPKVPQADLDDSDTNSVASTSRAKRASSKGKPEDAETPDKKTVKRTDNEGVDGSSARKGRESTPVGPAESPAKKKTPQVAKNNIKKTKLRPGQSGISKYLAPSEVTKQHAEALVKRAKSKSGAKENSKANSRRRSLVSGEESDSLPPANRPKISPPATKKKKDDAGEEGPAQVEIGSTETKEGEEEIETPTDCGKKPVVKKLSVDGNPRVTRSTGIIDRILRNGKRGCRTRMPLARRRSKTEGDVKSPLRDDDSQVEEEELQPEEDESMEGEATKPMDEVTPEEEPVAVIEEPVARAEQPFTPDEEVSRFPNGEEAGQKTTPLSPVSPVANSILINKNFTDTNSNNVKENRKPTDGQPLKAVETIINDIHSDWDSDEDGQCSVRDGKVPFGNVSPAQVTKENEAPKSNSLMKPPSRQVVSTPPLIEPDKAGSSTSDSRNIGMKMPPTTECLLKTKEINGFADSVELLAKRSSKIDFELLRRRTKRSMSLNVDPNDKLGHGKRTYGPAKPREPRTLVSMPRLSPEVDVTSRKPPPKNVVLTDNRLVRKSEELFDNLIARTKDKTKETDGSKPQETSRVSAPNGTCDDEEDIEEWTVVSPNSSPVPFPNVETDDPPSIPPPDLETETNPLSVPPPELRTELNPSSVPPPELETERNPSPVPPSELDTESNTSLALLPDLETDTTTAVPVKTEEAEYDEPEEAEYDEPEESEYDESEESEYDEPEDRPRLGDDGEASMRSDDFCPVSADVTVRGDPEVTEPEVSFSEDAAPGADLSEQDPLELNSFDSGLVKEEIEREEHMTDTAEPAGEEARVEDAELVENEEENLVEMDEEDNLNSSDISESYINEMIEEVPTTEEQPTEVQPTEVQPTEVQPTEEQPTEVQPTEEQPTTADEEEESAQQENLEEAVVETSDGCQVMPMEGELTAPKDPEPKSNVQPSATIDIEGPCGPSVSSLSSILDANTTRFNLDLNIADLERKRREICEEEKSPETRASKEHVLNSLGLQSRRSVAEAAGSSTSGSGRSAKNAQRTDSGSGGAASSGRLKVVINLPKEKSKPLRMLFKNGKPYPSHPEATPLLPSATQVGMADEGDVNGKSQAANSHVEGNGTADNALLSLSNGRVNIGALPDVAASTSDADGKNKQPGSLVIPEKSSSFSIHPDRLCSDVCSYCYGKFGLLDTPCHIAQLKNRNRQMKILAVETHLAMDSCLCDACIRHVDRRANGPSEKPAGGRRERNSGTQPVCCVNGCPKPAGHTLRKNWYEKIQNSVAIQCPVNLDLLNCPSTPHLPLCEEHHSYMDYFLLCGICKKRLSQSHMYGLTDVQEINICLEADDIPARVSDRLFVCELCRLYVDMRKNQHSGSHSTLSASQRKFLNWSRKRILRCHEILVSDSEEDGEGELQLPMDGSVSSAGDGSCSEDQPRAWRKRTRSIATPPTENSVAAEGEAPRRKARTAGGSAPRSKDKVGRSDSVTERTNAEKAKSQPPIRLCLSNVTTNPQSGSAEWVRKDMPPFFPREDELPLHANIEPQPEDTPSGQKGWEKCNLALQFDKETKKLWQELQRPYGSQSSFIRHLVLMERYWRQGELTLTATTDRARLYTNSVQNRLTAYGTTFVSKKTPQATATAPAPAPTPKPVPTPAQAPQEMVVPPVKPAPLKPNVAMPRLIPVSQPSKTQAKQSPQSKSPLKQQKILPKPSTSTSVWEPVGKNASSNRPIFVTSTPVVNLTSSVSLTAVPGPSTSSSTVPEVVSVNSDPLSVARTNRPSSWNSSGGFVSIAPSSSMRASNSPNVSASITPFFRSNSANTSPSTPVPPSSSHGTELRVDCNVAGNQVTKARPHVHVTAGGKAFSLTIAQFKKLQALRQQRQLELQTSGHQPAGAGAGTEISRRGSSSSEPAIDLTSDDVNVGTESTSQGVFGPIISNVRTVTSDEAIAMWDEPDRTEEYSCNPQLEITPIEPAPPVLPKISKDLSVTHVSNEMTLMTLVPSRALAHEIHASTAFQTSATVTAPEPAAVSTMVPATVLD